MDRLRLASNRGMTLSCSFCDFLKDAEANNWFESNLVRRMREFAGCR